MSTSRNSKIRVAFYAFVALAALANIFGTPYYSVPLLTPLAMALIGLASLVLTYQLTVKTICAAVGVVLFLFFCQALGANTGFPFGEFAYTSGLGPKVLDVPLVMPLAWLSILIPAWVAADKVLRYRNLVVASIIVAAVDAVLEFTADALDLWHWKGGFPTELNVISWFVVSYLALTILGKYATEKEPDPIVPHFLFGQLIYFALTDIGLCFLVH
ncbi:MAG: carotenoid biosynthesis protein [Ignavibacteriales bacterium]|nr:carotenoid biosynthesis protein [Ignavibacteriales bacterium]